MEKFDFTTAGVAAANMYFYAMNTPELHVVVREVQLDLPGWAKRTFKFSESQIQWIDALDDTFVFQLSNQLANTMTFRLPFRLDKEEPGAKSVVFGIKRGDSHNPIKSKISSEGDVAAEGELVLRISY
ncbi:hypothetical protein [Sphingobacterium yanglingense]|uniref:Uncharacterized protein n=1 Tax=Sphingobacterium yanglingense TaxID=1437280 RepID=A0A4R6W4P4_9SPHI|nr:hypothetical protein [Sphingobacterium yanglingense]TDQ73664.1 hypothetical protein CLV99_4100 [Sphingobacterium yanglingense]